jgi:hypothetical protein
MQVFRQALMQIDQDFDGRDVALLPSILLRVGSKFVLSSLKLLVHLGLCPEPQPVPARPARDAARRRVWETVTALRLFRQTGTGPMVRPIR